MPSDRSRNPLPALLGRPAAALASCVLLVAAASAPEGTYRENMARLRLMPLAARESLAAALARYDELPPDRRRAIEEFDERINALDAETRAARLATLRAYHVWYKGLSEKDREKIDSAPDDSARAEIIHKLRAADPRPGLLVAGDVNIQFSDLGAVAPIELGNWLRVWLNLADTERKRIDSLAVRGKQVGELTRLGRLYRIPAKEIPTEEEEAILRRLEVIPILKSLNNQFKNRLAKAEENGPAAKKKIAPAVVASRPLRHLTEAVYFAEHPPKPAAAADLARFEAALPRWVAETLEPMPAAEARRRLTILYREVYPPPLEMPRPKEPPPPPATPKTPAVPSNSSDKLTPF